MVLEAQKSKVKGSASDKGLITATSLAEDGKAR
jgi:hypothetical protein